MEKTFYSMVFDEMPFFAGITDEQKEFIGEKSSIVTFKKGQIIYEENSPPSNFYCLLCGRVKIYTTDTFGNITVLEYLHRGTYFGIISLLTDEPHSVTAQAMNDCVILVLTQQDFKEILNRVPRLAIDLSQTLSRRLKRKDVHQKIIFESTIISVFSSHSQVGKTVYAINLAISLAKETRKKTMVMSIVSDDKTHSIPQKLSLGSSYPIINLTTEGAINNRLMKDYVLHTEPGADCLCIHYHVGDEDFSHRVVELLSILVNDYNYILIDIPAEMEVPIFNILNQSDFIHVLSSGEEVDLKKAHNLISRLKEEFHFQESKIKVIINEYRTSKLDPEEQVDMLGRPVFATLPHIAFSSTPCLVVDEPESEYAKAVRRISRQLGMRLVGLSLGVGAAYGFCHLGVLKVIEEEKIPIDVIAGSSIGALIASLWVTGYSSQEILAIVQSEFRVQQNIFNILDFTFPNIGFLKGNKLHRFLKKHLKNKTFRDVRLPLKIIASDLRKKESIILDRGSLIDAIMASCAMPGVFQPIKLKEDMLFDGGVVSPLPTEPLIKLGIKKIIAVNVTPSKHDILKQYEELREQLSGAKKDSSDDIGFIKFKHYIEKTFKNNILDIIFSSIELLQSEVAEKEAQLADIVLHPNIAGMFWLELHRSQEFARRGEEETRRQLDKIWQLINE